MPDFNNPFNRATTAGLGGIPASAAPVNRNMGVGSYRPQMPQWMQQQRMQPQMQQSAGMGGIGSYLTGAPQMKWQLPQWMQRRQPQQAPQMQQLPQQTPQMPEQLRRQQIPQMQQPQMQPQQPQQPQVDLSKYNPNNFGEFINGTKTSAELMPVWQQLLDARSKLPPNEQHAAYTKMIDQLANASMHRNVEAAAMARKAAGAPESSWYPEGYTPQTTVQGLQGPKIG